MNTKLNPKIYTGPSGGLKKDSPWLASEDIGTREVRVTIEQVELHENVEFDKGRKESVVGAIKFVGKQKRMVLNSVNRKALVAAFGMDTANWPGKQITLWVDTNVRFGRDKVCGLRIKTDPQPARTTLDGFEGDAQTLADIEASKEVQS